MWKFPNNRARYSPGENNQSEEEHEQRDDNDRSSNKQGIVITQGCPIRSAGLLPAAFESKL